MNIDIPSLLMGKALGSGGGGGGGDEPKLPDEYQRVEYLDFTPDAGFKLTVPAFSSLTVECASDTTDSNHCVIGYRENSYTNYDWNVGIGNVNNVQSLRFWAKGSGYYHYYDAPVSIVIGQKMTFHVVISGSRTYAYVGRYSTKDSEYYGWDGKFYSLKARDTYSGELLADFVPCYKKADNTIGIYDTVGKAFYGTLTASGSGAVAKGPDVN